MITTSLRKIRPINIPAILRGDYIKNGQGDRGYITGIITEQSLPVSRRVFCYHRLTGMLVADELSMADGSYRFDGLVAGVKYYITSIDENNDGIQHNAVTQDLVIASEVAV